MRYVIGMDIGGTHIRVGAVGEDGELRGFRKVLQKDLLGENPAESCVKLVREVAAEQLDKGEPSALVVGFPAVLDKGRKIVWNAPNLEGLDGKDT